MWGVILLLALFSIRTAPAQGLQDSEPSNLSSASTDELISKILQYQATPEDGPIEEESEPDLKWQPSFSPENGLRLWDCISIALENNRPLRNARDDLRLAQVTLRERIEEYGNIYFLGAGAHYDENLAHSPVDRYSFSMGGLEGGDEGFADGTVMSRRFTSGGIMSLGARSTYHPTDVDRITTYVDNQGNLTDIATVEDIRWFSEANLVISQPLLDGAGEVATTDLRVQELEKAATALDLERFIQTTVNTVVRNYLAVQRAISVAIVQRDSYVRARDLFNLTRSRKPYRAAGIGPLQLIRSEQQVTNTHQQFVDARNNVDTALIDLRLTLGLEPDRAIILAGTDVPIVDTPAFEVDSAVQTALRQRPDLRSLDLVRRQRELFLLQAENGLLPNLNLAGRMGFHHEDEGFSESWELFEYQDVGADLRLNLPLNLPSDRANYDRAQIVLRQAATTIEQRKREIANDVDEAYRGQSTLRERIDILRENEKLAAETYRIISGQAEFGQDESGREVDAFNLAQAQNDLTNASTTRVRAEIDYVIAISILDLQIGRPLSEVLARYSPPAPPPK
jgi:outer membrane protein